MRNGIAMNFQTKNVKPLVGGVHDQLKKVPNQWPTTLIPFDECSKSINWTF